MQTRDSIQTIPTTMPGAPISNRLSATSQHRAAKQISAKHGFPGWTRTAALLLPLLLLTLSTAAQAQTTFRYTTNNGTITITGIDVGSGRVSIIPSQINGLPVTTIGAHAFHGLPFPFQVVVPNSVTTIEAFAFASTFRPGIPNSVTTIGAYAFERAFVTYIPNGVTSIGDWAFSSCNELYSVTIPNGVTILGSNVFYNCSLTTVTIGNSVTSIGTEAFSSCQSLTNVTIGNSVTNIGDSAFGNCTKLTAITVEALNSAYSSSDGVLFNKNQTKLIQCPGSKTNSYTVPNSVTSIGNSAFYGCSSLTSVTIPASVTNIGDSAFASCTKLTSLYFQGNAPSLGSSVFSGANNVTVFYPCGTAGWGPAFGGRPATLYDSDTDGDGIGNCEELFAYGTNPLLADTDGDGMPDGWEVANGLNPRLTDANSDLDLDGLTNLQEYQNRALGYRANQADSLGDGRSDYERLFGTQTNRFYYDRNDRLIGADYNRGSNGFAIAYVYDGNGNLLRQKTLVRDANHNGLPDLWEFLNGLTNNASAYADSDGDGWSDYQEWRGGSSPTNPGSAPTNAPQTQPLAVVLSNTNTLSGLASLTVRLWDSEGNAATPFLEYQVTGTTSWQPATLLWLDGSAYATNRRVAALPDGVNHSLVWNALTNLGPGVNTNVLLRARAEDLSLLGEWSAGTSFRVDTSLASSPDSDGDGLPDIWELQYFGSLTQLGNDDFDHDGFSNRAEYLADTNPTNSASYLRLTSVIPLPGGVKLDWIGGIQATQWLQRSFGLGNANAWLNIYTAAPPTATSGSYTDGIGTNALQFYRLKVNR